MNDAAAITDEELEALPAYECSSRLTAGWLIGVDRRERFRACNSDLLLASEVCYSGSAYCFALTCFAYADAEILTAYLDRYLPRTHLQYDQPATLGALLRLDALLGAHHADRFTEPDGFWDHWVKCVRRLGYPSHIPAEQRRWADLQCEFANGWSAVVPAGLCTSRPTTALDSDARPTGFTVPTAPPRPSG
ncbi:DUF6000 family protein [Streptomyces nigra]|uniref:DUF6000 family protein n=1 Tax=Streptomyces nigra TaxID=1827580 RepID=UPI0034147BDB